MGRNILKYWKAHALNAFFLSISLLLLWAEIHTHGLVDGLIKFTLTFVWGWVFGTIIGKAMHHWVLDKMKDEHEEKLLLSKLKRFQ